MKSLSRKFHKIVLKERELVYGQPSLCPQQLNIELNRAVLVNFFGRVMPHKVWITGLLWEAVAFCLLIINFRNLDL